MSGAQEPPKEEKTFAKIVEPKVTSPVPTMAKIVQSNLPMPVVEAQVNGPTVGQLFVQPVAAAVPTVQSTPGPLVSISLGCRLIDCS